VEIDWWKYITNSSRSHEKLNLLAIEEIAKMGCFFSHSPFPTASELTLDEKKRLSSPSTWSTFKASKFPITVAYPSTWILHLENSKGSSVDSTDGSNTASGQKKQACPKSPLYQITVKTGFKHFPHHKFCSAELAVIADEVPRRKKMKTEDQSNSCSGAGNPVGDDKECEPIGLDEFLKMSPIVVGAQVETGAFLANRGGVRMVFLPPKNADGTQSRLESLVAFSASGKLVYSVNFFVADAQYYDEFKDVAQKFFDSIAIDFLVDA